MSKREISHKINILATLFETDLKLTATDFSYVSNANQYFVELENQDLITSEWGKKGNSKVKLRFVTSEQKNKVKTYLDLFDKAKNEK